MASSKAANVFSGAYADAPRWAKMSGDPQDRLIIAEDNFYIGIYCCRLNMFRDLQSRKWQPDRSIHGLMQALRIDIGLYQRFGRTNHGGEKRAISDLV
jgi:hypothetical protein